MNDEILKLAKEVTNNEPLYCRKEFTFSRKELESFYRAAYNKAIEDAAVCAWSHYGDVCKSKGINPNHFGEWISSAAIRKLEIKP